MTLFVKLGGWASYIGTQLAIAEVDEQYAEEAVNKYKSLYALASNTEKTVTAAKAKLYESEEYVELVEANHQAYAFKKLVGSLFANTERSAQEVSREISRRIGRNDRETRSAKWST